MRMQTGKCFTPDLPHPPAPPPKIWLLPLGTGSPVGKCFFQNPPHMCVQNYEHDDRIILRLVCWGTGDPYPHRARTAAGTPP